MICIAQEHPLNTIDAFNRLHHRVLEDTGLTLCTKTKLPTKQDFLRIEKEVADLGIKGLWQAMVSEEQVPELDPTLTPAQIKAYLLNPDHSEGLRQYNRITLSGNLLTIPPSIGSLQNLKTLKLMFCQLKQIPDNLIDVNLLVVDRCPRLTGIPVLPNLQFLDIIDSPIETLPALPELTRLSLVNTRLKTLPPLPILTYFNSWKNEEMTPEDQLAIEWQLKAANPAVEIHWN